MTRPNARPIGENFLVLPDPPVSETASGLTIPKVAMQKQKVGTVVARGDSAPADIAVGTRLMWLYTIASDIVVDGVTYLVMNITDVAVILPPFCEEVAA